MDYVLAKVKRQRKKPFLKLLSDHTLFDQTIVDLDFCIPYAPDHNLDEDAWFKLDNFKQRQYCIELLKSELDSKEFDDLKRSQFCEISYLLAVQGDDVYFQKINPGLFIKRKTICFGEIAQVENSSNRLVINDRPDAVYLKSSDTLIFRNLAVISSIFEGIDTLYKEATQEDVAEFLGESFVLLNGGYDASHVSKPNRKRIALAMATLEQLSEQDKAEMLSYINSYCSAHLKLDEESSKFLISKDDELKMLLYGIEQRFYTTPFGREKRLANSVQPIG
jgi:hypothetical protein